MNTFEIEPKMECKCYALTKKGNVCGNNTRGTLYCKRHSSYIDISKPLFDATSPPLNIHFMDLNKIVITDKMEYKTLDAIIKTIKSHKPEQNDVVFSLYEYGGEDAICEYTNQTDLYCLFRPLETMTSNTYIVGSTYDTCKILFGGIYEAIRYRIVKRSKCYITFKNDKGEDEFSKKIKTRLNNHNETEEYVSDYAYLQAINFEYQG
jgi:hypothetical protein